MSRGVRDVRLFELGTAFAPSRDGPPHESARVAVVLTGGRTPPHWSSAGEAFDVHDIAGVLEVIAREALAGGSVVPAAEPARLFVPGRSYELVAADGGPVVGWGGEVRPELVDLPPWAGAVVGAEVVLPAVPPPRPDATARDLPDQPAVQRDLAFLVPGGTAAGDVLDAARKAAGRLLETGDVFDVYEGDDLPPGTRSVALRLRFRARGRTLTDREVDRACRRVLRTVKEKTGVEPRR